MTGGTHVSLPVDSGALLAGRVWDPAVSGPSVVAVRDTSLVDLSATFPTMRDLVEHPDPARALADATGPALGSLAEIYDNTPEDVRDRSRPWLLSPIDLQIVKAAGVTFPVSMIERVIEEKARGDADAAAPIRERIRAQIGSELGNLVPGSPEAAKLKAYLISEGMWSQYLEVGIGPDAEIFTKAPVLATVGPAVRVGVRDDSEWNNPEPEVVLVVASTGSIVGAALGNDVNLRDIEGRSALLLGEAKDNAASASVGPFIRFFDAEFGLDELRSETVSLRVDGEDGFVLEGTSPLSQISRDPADLVRQALAHHQYPDGFVLYLGTMFAPGEDRDEPGRGFTHHVDDVVTISSPRLGALVNRVARTRDVEPWVYGSAALFTGLARRGLISAMQA